MLCVPMADEPNRCISPATRQDPGAGTLLISFRDILQRVPISFKPVHASPQILCIKTTAEDARREDKVWGVYGLCQNPALHVRV
jgi:hypothetical protein